jgi:hypothetical protein
VWVDGKLDVSGSGWPYNKSGVGLSEGGVVPRMFKKVNPFGVRGGGESYGSTERRFFCFFLGPGGMEASLPICSPPPAA